MVECAKNQMCQKSKVPKIKSAKNPKMPKYQKSKNLIFKKISKFSKISKKKKLVACGCVGVSLGELVECAEFSFALQSCYKGSQQLLVCKIDYKHQPKIECLQVCDCYQSPAHFMLQRLIVIGDV